MIAEAIEGEVLYPEHVEEDRYLVEGAELGLGILIGSIGRNGDVGVNQKSPVTKGWKYGNRQNVTEKEADQINADFINNMGINLHIKQDQKLLSTQQFIMIGLLEFIMVTIQIDPG